jgi:polysaccharide export outer membrane protein
MRYFILIFLLMGTAACSTANRANLKENGGDVYGVDQVGSFIAATGPGATREYVIGLGDRLDIPFFFHNEMTRANLLVRTDGRITLPYVGDVIAAGYTPMQLDTLLTDQFAAILKDPNLSVVVRHSEDPTVYVVGMVTRPGGYTYKRYLSLTQAVALAGGLRRGAHTGSVLVLRREGVGRIVGVQVDLESIMNGQDIQNDFALRNMDLVVVSKTALEGKAQTMEAIQDILSPLTDLISGTWQVILISDNLRND